MPSISPLYAITGFTPEQNAEFGRVIQEFEALPTSTQVFSTAVLTLTTTPQDVPTLSSTVSVPGNAIVHVGSVLDIGTTNAVVVGTLVVTDLAAGTSVSPSANISQGTTNCGSQRGPFFQQWEFHGLQAGRYRFRMQAERTSAGPVGSAGRTIFTHSNLKVSVT